MHVNTFCFAHMSEIVLEKHEMTEFAGSPKPNQLRAAHGHICRARQPYVMSLECIYQISVAWLDPLKLQQAGRGKVRIALPPSILLCDILLPESGNGTFVFPLCVLLGWEPLLFCFSLRGS